MKSPEKINTYIINWLSSYAEQAKCNGFVVGVSGGIDSALTSTLCAHTKLPILCLEMEIHQAANQVSRAKNHIDWLEKNFNNVSHHSVSLTSTFLEFKNKMTPFTNQKEDTVSLSLANTRSRLRMTTLYYFAALHNYLVVGTGNKVEDFGIGFFTKYGDGGVDLSPIADLTKTEVYKLAESLNINKDILEAPPTDGLFGDNRTDEDQIGTSYKNLEWAMEVDENEIDIETLSAEQQKAYAIYKNLNKKNRHKVVPIPVCKIPKELF